MKYLITGILLFLINNRAKSQVFDSNSAIDSSDVLMKCLKVHLDFTKDIFKERPNEMPTSINVENRSGTVIADKKTFTIEPFTITTLTRPEIVSYIKKNGYIRLTVIRPVEIVKDSLRIGMIDYIVTFRKKILAYGHEKSSTIILKYDCKTKLFAIIDIEQSGI